MDKYEILSRLASLSLDPSQYWVITGSAMVLYGLRPLTHDIDLGCTSALADRLECEGCPVTRRPDGSRKLTIGSDVELFENWLCDRVQIVEGLPVISLAGLAQMKRFLGREKDLRDLALIEQRLRP